MCLLAAAAAFLVSLRSPRAAMAASDWTPAYTAGGDLVAPKDYREWIYVTTGIDMSYEPKAAGMEDHSKFDNIFVNPEAYRSFVATGTWPDKTVMVLEAREAGSKGSINQSGHFQSGGVMDLAFHVKDEARFPGKWAFFSYNSTSGNAGMIPQKADCYTCHTAHAAVDTTFVQFYPTLLPVAQKKGTLSEAYLKDEAATSVSK
jgi:hypothetical protein